MQNLLTPSTAYECFELLRVLERQRLTRPEVVNLNFGIVPAHTILDHASSLNWVFTNIDGHIAITERGRACLELNHSTSQLRFMLADYFIERRDPWLQLVRYGRRQVLLQSPPEISQLLYEAGLADGEDQEVIDFWDKLGARVRGENDKRKLELGRTGERLSIKYETKRTRFRPKWMALDGDHYGYDILSRQSFDDDTPLKIEAKCSTARVSNAFFFITRNEWETAESSKDYHFHLWCLEDAYSNLAVLRPSDISPQIPANKGSGVWETVRIPFAIFENHFDKVTEAANGS